MAPPKFLRNLVKRIGNLGEIGFEKIRRDGRKEEAAGGNASLRLFSGYMWN